MVVQIRFDMYYAPAALETAIMTANELTEFFEKASTFFSARNILWLGEMQGKHSEVIIEDMNQLSDNTFVYEGQETVDAVRHLENIGIGLNNLYLFERFEEQYAELMTTD